jgi:hypothetical protein
MKFLVITSGNLLPIAAELESEGCDVTTLYEGDCYEGMLKDRTPDVRILKDLDPETNILSDSVNGKKLDELREYGNTVIGPSAWTQNLVDNPEAGFRAAQAIGMSVPTFFTPKTFAALAKFLKEYPDTRWALSGSEEFVEHRPGDMLYWLRSAKKGAKASGRLTLRMATPRGAHYVEETLWWNGEMKPRVEAAYCVDSEYGYEMGEVLDPCVRVFCQPRRSNVHWDRLYKSLEKSKHFGPITVRFSVPHHGGGKTFEGWKVGPPFDQFFCRHSLTKWDFARFLTNGFNSICTDDFAASIRVRAGNVFRGCMIVPSGRPFAGRLYPLQVKQAVEHMEVIGKDISVVTGLGTSAREALDNAERMARHTHTSCSQIYRTDGGETWQRLSRILASINL